jgi:hypothetical protein
LHEENAKPAMAFFYHRRNTKPFRIQWLRIVKINAFHMQSLSGQANP